MGWIRPNISDEHFHIVNLPYPNDSGAKVNFAHRLFSLIAPETESLILIDDWGVWPSSQHLPLFARFREALGEQRSLNEAPGHVAADSDTDDAVSIIAIALLFIWGCYGISSSGRDTFYFSHDQYCYFASRDVNVAAHIASQFVTT